MRNSTRTLFATAALAAATLAFAAPASAATPIITLSNQSDPFTLPDGQFLVAAFDDVDHPDAVTDPGQFHLTITGATVGINEGMGGYSGTLFNDTVGHYLTIPTNGVVELTSTVALRYLSFYMGSPDDYNSVEFNGLGGYHEVVPGNMLVNGDTNQSWSWGKRVSFDFGSKVVTNVKFTSSNNSFELDNIAAGVPEASTWALMIMGFGGAGAMLRRRRGVAAVA